MITDVVQLRNVFEHVLHSRPWIHPGPVWSMPDTPWEAPSTELTSSGNCIILIIRIVQLFL